MTSGNGHPKLIGYHRNIPRATTKLMLVL